MPRAERGDGDGPDIGAAFTVMLGWHALVIIAYFVILGRQSTLRVRYDNSPFEDMLILGANTAPVLLGTAAASPTLLFVAAVAGPALR
ncbi:hypothetical protein [Micromonospora sp. NPDC001898]|uniref:hypothetical protein n=1 Tax=Micromonospora sp. NPDC001898 TaxID=3364221 RepID=UPI0036A42665